MALIGGGGIARTAFNDCRYHNVLAVADVDLRRGADAFNEFPSAKQYKDFRKMLDAHDKELDAVIVSTPDHTHFPGHLRGDGTRYRGADPEAADSQHLAGPHAPEGLTRIRCPDRPWATRATPWKAMRLIREWYEGDMLGEVREVHAWTNRTTKNISNAKHTLEKQSVPADLDWDLWIGGAKFNEYNKELCPSGWRWWWDYGLGGLGDIGCHTLDIPKYCHGTRYPTSVHVDNRIDFSQEYHDKAPKEEGTTYVYEFPARGDKPPVTVYWYEGGHLPKLPESLKKNPDIPGGGCLMVGDKNTLFSPGMRPRSPRLVDNWLEVRRELPPKTIPRAVGARSRNSLLPSAVRSRSVVPISTTPFL